MHKTEFMRSVAYEAHVSTDLAKHILEVAFDIIQKELVRGGRIQILGFGTFSVKERSERKGTNPRTGEEIHLPAKKRPHFTASKSFKAAVNLS